MKKVDKIELLLLFRKIRRKIKDDLSGVHFICTMISNSNIDKRIKDLALDFLYKNKPSSTLYVPLYNDYSFNKTSGNVWFTFSETPSCGLNYTAEMIHFNTQRLLLLQLLIDKLK